MVNLLQETLAALHRCQYTESDVSLIFLRKGKKACTWVHFRHIANFKYDNGYGSQKIVDDLVIIMKDGSWFERHEYDGSEIWLHKSRPIAYDTDGVLTRKDLLYV